MLLFNLAAIVWLLLCYAASFISPETLKMLALFSLTTPFALIINLAFVFLWLFTSQKIRALLSVSVLVLCWKMIPAVFGFHYFAENDWTKSENSFKLMSWNVHALGTFDSPLEKEYADGIFSLIKDENPDILCLPEFATEAGPENSPYARKIIKANGYKAYHFNMDNGYGPKIWIGTAVFSKFPLARFKATELSPYIFLVECDITIRGEVVRVGVVHLKSFGLSDKDKELIEQVKQQKTAPVNKYKTFIDKFTAAYQLRAQEAEKLRKIISKSPYPVVLCGDFNDLPYSYTYARVKGDLRDAFADKGRGFGRTYNQIIPTLRIDYILYNDNYLKIKAFKTLYSPFSDHSPVMANFEIVRGTLD